MPLEFQHVFAGEGVGRGEEKGQALVESLTGFVPEPGKKGLPWFRHLTNHR
jgi:hypothetical protein